ncbi:8-oxoguanine DNA glycosylase, N-terminal domain-containing protein [Toxoplasma gondii ARI]|uniref:8-oxoguanine DNA glycosylase, N-terminal domain-containing protein n=1 Tax=Toxoplasma gondii ARI TaxID=1074872 RepID=A0A139XLM0_TOXGO|nr:8-oxoguanine DNA glycosylase, N-terminal domain-containing protein [Toxoplasma gondii ARI]
MCSRNSPPPAGSFAVSAFCMLAFRRLGRLSATLLSLFFSLFFSLFLLLCLSVCTPLPSRASSFLSSLACSVCSSLSCSSSRASSVSPFMSPLLLHFLSLHFSPSPVASPGAGFRRTRHRRRNFFVLPDFEMKSEGASSPKTQRGSGATAKVPRGNSSDNAEDDRVGEGKIKEEETATEDTQRLKRRRKNHSALFLPHSGHPARLSSRNSLSTRASSSSPSLSPFSSSLSPAPSTSSRSPSSSPSPPSPLPSSVPSSPTASSASSKVFFPLSRLREANWRDLCVPAEELRPEHCLTTGQTFQFVDIGHSPAFLWEGLVGRRVFQIIQTPTTTLYRCMYSEAKGEKGRTAKGSSEEREEEAEAEALRAFFNLDVSLAALKREWEARRRRPGDLAEREQAAGQIGGPKEGGCLGGNARRKSLEASRRPARQSEESAASAGRVLQLPVVECFFSFLCSSNNNIPRIMQMVRALRNAYGDFLVRGAEAAAEKRQMQAEPDRKPAGRGGERGHKPAEYNGEETRDGRERDLSTAPSPSNVQDLSSSLALSPSVAASCPSAASTDSSSECLLVDSRDLPLLLASSPQLTWHSFPSSSALARAREEDLKKLGLGYRARLLHSAAKALDARGGDAFLLSLREARRRQGHPDSKEGTVEKESEESVFQVEKEIREALLPFAGIGRKVADCVALYSLGCWAAWPVDTHLLQHAQSDLEFHAFLRQALKEQQEAKRTTRGNARSNAGPTPTQLDRKRRAAREQLVSSASSSCPSPSSSSSLLCPVPLSPAAVRRFCRSAAGEKFSNLSEGLYSAVQSFYQRRFGVFAGWAQSYVFTEALRRREARLQPQNNR